MSLTLNQLLYEHHAHKHASCQEQSNESLPDSAHAQVSQFHESEEHPYRHEKQLLALHAQFLTSQQYRYNLLESTVKTLHQHHDPLPNELAPQFLSLRSEERRVGKELLFSVVA